MKGITQKRIALLFVAMLFVLAVAPAFYPIEDDAGREDSFFSRAMVSSSLH